MLADYKGWNLRQLEIGNAFVEAYLPPGEEVYVDNIPGFEKPCCQDCGRDITACKGRCEEALSRLKDYSSPTQTPTAHANV